MIPTQTLIVRVNLYTTDNDDTNAIPNETTNDNSNASQPLPDETEGESSESVITDTSN